MANPTNFAGGVPVPGLSQVLKRLRALPLDLQKKGLKTAMRKGATVVRKAAIENVRTFDDPETKEKIFRNVVVQFAPRYSKRITGVVMRVGVLGGARQYASNVVNKRRGRVGKTFAVGGDKGNPGGDTWYWRFLEFGVPSHGIKAEHPMTHALEQNSGRATDVIVSSLDLEITKVMLVRTGL